MVSPVRKSPWLAVTGITLLSCLHAQDDISTRLETETARITKELEAGPRLSLPPSPGDEHTDSPPAIVASAGKEFVDAWSLWHRVITQPVVVQKPVTETKSVNAYEEMALFRDLLDRTIKETPPPKSSDYSKFTYKSLDWCGDGSMRFMQLFHRGHTLALLRNGDTFPALRALATDPRSPAFDPLSRAFGLDPQELRIGKWLHKGCLPDDLCNAGGDKTALMLLKWAELHWDREIERQKEIKAGGITPHLEEPYLPRLDLLLLLRPDNGVTDETKEKIARFIETKGVEMLPPGHWIRLTPKGGEKWMVPLAKQGLTHELNAIRKRSSTILRMSGIEHAAPELRPAPQFRVTVNGKPWPGDAGTNRSWGEPGMSFDCGEPGKGGGRAFSLQRSPEGLFTADPDNFFEQTDIRTIEVYDFPSTGSPIGPRAPWLRASVKLPVKFDGINEIDIKTLPVTIRPQLPAERVGSKHVLEIEFDRFDEGHVSDGSYRYHLEPGSKEIVLPHISPGDYWLRVRHPGTALSERMRLSVNKTNSLLEPKLELGASVVVPIEWPEGKSPEKLPMDLARTLAWAGDEHSGLTQLLELCRDGKRFSCGPVPVSAKGLFPKSAIFANLPPGDYEIIVPARTWKPEDEEPAYSIRQTSIKITVSKDSPEFITAAPLRVDLTSP